MYALDSGIRNLQAKQGFLVSSSATLFYVAPVLASRQRSHYHRILPNPSPTSLNNATYIENKTSL